MSDHLDSSENTEFLKFEYHVIYSISYSVPVLYFTASRQGNNFILIFLLVKLEELQLS